jgi:hypothetical protein
MELIRNDNGITKNKRAKLESMMREYHKTHLLQQALKERIRTLAKEIDIDEKAN